MKILLRVVLGLCALLVVVLVVGLLFIDSLVATAVEKGATYGTGVETKLGSADVGLFSGNLGLKKLSIANPPGFRPEPFLQLGEAKAAWSNESLMSDTILINGFTLDKVELNLERTAGKTNYGVILKNLEQLSSKKEEEPKGEPGPTKTIKVRKIEIKNVKVELHLTDTPVAAGDYKVAVPVITVDDFDSSGSTSEVVAKLTRVMLQAILEAALKSGKNIFPSDLLKDLGSELGDLGKGAGKILKDAPKDLGKGVEDALKGAGDVFKKKK